MTWLVDTQLVADWCLWDLADEPDARRRIERAGRTRSVLGLRTYVNAFVRALEGSEVLVPASVLVEVGGVIRREISTPYRGRDDRLNEAVVRVTLRFTDRFGAKVVHVSESAADAALGRLNAKLPEHGRRIDLGDAALVAALMGKRTLLTADKPLYDRCVNLGQPNVFLFSEGEILDERGHPLRRRR